MNTDPDILPSGKSIYDVSKSEIFWRNFIAGFARGLGGFLFAVIIFAILTALTAQLLMPYLNPIIESLSSLTGTMNSLNDSQSRVAP